MLPFPPAARPRGRDPSPDLPGDLFSAIQLQDRGNPDFPDALLRVRLLTVVLAAAQFTFHLNMRSFGECLGELRELAENDATVPFGVRDVLIVLLIGGLGCQRESVSVRP